MGRKSGSTFTLNEGEEVIGASARLDDVLERTGLVLTSQRIILFKKTGLFSRDMHSISIDKIDSVVVRIRSNMGLIIFSLFIIGVGIKMLVDSAGGIVLVVGIVLLLLALATRSRFINVISGATTMPINIRGTSRKVADELVAEIEQAKVRRIVSLTKGRDPVSHAPVAVMPPSSAASIEERLMQLDLLKNRGMLSEDEYREKRRTVIESL